MTLARWPHPSPWWGEEFWPPLIFPGLPLLVVAVIVEGMVQWFRKERR